MQIKIYQQHFLVVTVYMYLFFYQRVNKKLCCLLEFYTEQECQHIVLPLIY